MSFEVIFNTGAGDQIATTRGWCNVTRWVDTLPADRFAALHSLAQDGLSDDILDLEHEIQEALVLKRPSEHVRGTLARLVEMINANPDAEQFIISSGA